MEDRASSPGCPRLNCEHRKFKESAHKCKDERGIWRKNPCILLTFIVFISPVRVCHLLCIEMQNGTEALPGWIYIGFPWGIGQCVARLRDIEWEQSRARTVCDIACPWRGFPEGGFGCQVFPDGIFQWLWYYEYIRFSASLGSLFICLGPVVKWLFNPIIGSVQVYLSVSRKAEQRNSKDKEIAPKHLGKPPPDLSLSAPSSCISLFSTVLPIKHILPELGKAEK